MKFHQINKIKSKVFVILFGILYFPLTTCFAREDSRRINFCVYNDSKQFLKQYVDIDFKSIEFINGMLPIREQILVDKYGLICSNNLFFVEEKDGVYGHIGITKLVMRVGSRSTEVYPKFIHEINTHDIPHNRPGIIELPDNSNVHVCGAPGRCSETYQYYASDDFIGEKNNSRVYFILDLNDLKASAPKSKAVRCDASKQGIIRICLSNHK